MRKRFSGFLDFVGWWSENMVFTVVAVVSVFYMLESMACPTWIENMYMIIVIIAVGYKWFIGQQKGGKL